MTKDYSLEKWLTNRYRGDSPKEAISRAVDNLITKSAQKELPVKLSEIARLVGINPFPIYRNQFSVGQIIEISNEFRIALKMKSGKPPSVYWHGYPRLRFSYAHELIHCLHYDFSFKPPIRIAPKAKGNEEEEYCNHGASLLVLPPKLVQEYIDTLESNDIIYVAANLAKKAQTSLHASMLHLINNDFLDYDKSKLYILSSNNEGYRGRGEKKPRCILSAQYLNDNKKKAFLPTYKGIEAISNSWSLLDYHNRLDSTSEFIVKNEIIEYEKKKYILNGQHKKIRDSRYVWSDLTIESLE